MTNGGRGEQGGDELELAREKGFVRGGRTRQDKTSPTAGPTAKMKQKGGKGRDACGENAFTYMYSRRMSSRLQKQSNVTVRMWWWDGGMVGCADRK